MIMVAGAVGWCLLLAGVFIFVVGVPQTHKPVPGTTTEGSPTDSKAKEVSPAKEPEPVKPAEDAKSLEARAKQAFSAVEEKLKNSNMGSEKQVAELDAFLKEFGDSIVAARARTMREKLTAPPEPKANPALAPAPEESPQEKRNKLIAAMKADPVNKHVIHAEELVAQRDLSGALAEYDRAVLLDPRNGTMYRGRAWVKSLLLRYDEALTDAGKAVELAPDDFSALGLQAVLAYTVGNEELYEKARKAALAKVANDTQTDWSAWIHSESVKTRRMHLGSAFEKKPPEKAEDWMWRGLYRSLTDREKDAESDFRQAIKLKPAGVTEAYTAMFEILDKHEDYKGRMDLFESRAKAAPDSFAAVSDLAGELLNSKDAALRDPKRALPLAQKAADLTNHKSAPAEDTLALALFNNGQVAKAYEIQKHAIELLPKDMSAADREQYVQHLAQYELVKPPDP